MQSFSKEEVLTLSESIKTVCFFNEVWYNNYACEFIRVRCGDARI